MAPKQTVPEKKPGTNDERLDNGSGEPPLVLSYACQCFVMTLSNSLKDRVRANTITLNKE